MIDRKTEELKNKKTKGIVIALSGDLGAGKTTFVQGLAKELGITQRLTSPTFILIRRYPIKTGILYHLDAYRLSDNIKSEIDDLGLAEIISDPRNIVLVEWAEKIKDFLPQDTQWIHFEYVDDAARKITID